MKAPIAQPRFIKANLAGLCRKLFWWALILSSSNLFINAQPILVNKNREKDFGKSLERYDPKNTASAGKRGQIDTPDDTIRVATNLVVSDVLVVNQKGNAILGLKRDDFIVTEDNAGQEVEMFSFGGNIDVPRTIVLVIDYSGSLRPYISDSINAAKLLVDKMRSTDRMAIVTDNVELLVDFTSDRTMLKSKLEWIRTEARSKKHSRSNQYQALLATLNELISVEDVRPIIVFQTDGDEALFFKPMDPKWHKYFVKTRDTEERFFGGADVKIAIERSRATIYSVVPGIRFAGIPPDQLRARGSQSIEEQFRARGFKVERPVYQRNIKENGEAQAEQSLIRQNFLVEISQISGGYTEFLEKPTDAHDIYSGILKVIENRYVIGYYPKNEARDGKRRNVKIEVKGHPEYVVIGRKTYFATGPSQ